MTEMITRTSLNKQWLARVFFIMAYFFPTLCKAATWDDFKNSGFYVEREHIWRCILLSLSDRERRPKIFCSCLNRPHLDKSHESDLEKSRSSLQTANWFPWRCRRACLRSTFTWYQQSLYQVDVVSQGDKNYAHETRSNQGSRAGTS